MKYESQLELDVHEDSVSSEGGVGRRSEGGEPTHARRTAKHFYKALAPERTRPEWAGWHTYLIHNTTL